MGLILNNRYKFGFVHIPKTGGRTLTHLLLKIKDSTEVTSHHGLSLLPDDSSYFYFTIVRNPFTRMVSAYKHECRKFGFVEFDKFLRETNETNPWYIPQQYYITSGVSQNRKISKVLKYENYEKEVREVLKDIGHPNYEKLPHLNRNPIYDRHPNLNYKKYCRHFYTEEWMKDFVRERYKNDFKIFNYELDI